MDASGAKRKATSNASPHAKDIFCENRSGQLQAGGPRKNLLSPGIPGCDPGSLPQFQLRERRALLTPLECVVEILIRLPSTTENQESINVSHDRSCSTASTYT